MPDYIRSLNTATKEDLARIPGIPAEAAQAIVDWRDEHGGIIDDVDELLNVDGITQNHIDHLRPWLCGRCTQTQAGFDITPDENR